MLTVFDTTKTYKFTKELFFEERGVTEDTSKQERWIKDIDGLTFAPLNEYYSYVGSSLVVPQWCEEIEPTEFIELTQAQLSLISQGIDLLSESESGLTDKEIKELDKIVKKLEKKNKK